MDLIKEDGVLGIDVVFLGCRFCGGILRKLVCYVFVVFVFIVCGFVVVDLFVV